jgi:hypothetical protein
MKHEGSSLKVASKQGRLVHWLRDFFLRASPLVERLVFLLGNVESWLRLCKKISLLLLPVILQTHEKVMEGSVITFTTKQTKVLNDPCGSTIKLSKH